MDTLAEIIDDLEAWTEGHASADLVVPLPMDTPEDVAAARDIIREGAEEARTIAADPSAATITGETPSTAAAVVLTLAVGIQGYSFLRAHGDEGHGCSAREFRSLVRSYRVIKPLAARLAADAHHPQARTSRRLLQELKARLKPLIARKVKAARRRSLARSEASSAATDTRDRDGGPQDRGEHLGASTIEEILDMSYDVSVDTAGAQGTDPGLAAELMDGSGLPTPAARTGGGRDPAFGEGAAAADTGRRPTSVAILWAILAILAVTATLGLGPMLRARLRPPVDTYQAYLPVAAMARIDDGRALVLQLDATWDDLDEDQRREAVSAAFARARDLEHVDEMIVRDARGTEVARVHE